jgi:hypothetical protein
LRTRISIPGALFALPMAALVFATAIQLYYCIEWWLHPPVIVLSVLQFFPLVAAGVFAFCARREVESKEVSLSALALLGVLLLVCAVSAFCFPFPPIFNIHSYSIYALADYFREGTRLPFFEKEQLMPIYTYIYPQIIQLAFIQKWVHQLILGVEARFGWGNLISIFFSVVSVLSVAQMLGKRAGWGLAFFLGFVLALPHCFDVFVKYPGSDSYTLLLATAFLVEAMRAIRTGNFNRIFFLAALSMVLRIYFVGVVGLFAVICAALSKATRGALMKLVATPRNFLPGLGLALVVAVPWFGINYSKYGSVTSHIANSAHSVAELPEREQWIGRFVKADMAGQVAEKNALEELVNGITAKSIYYKTFREKVGERPVVVRLLSSVFSSAGMLLVATALVLLALIRAWRKRSEYEELLAVHVSWFVACCLGWFLLSLTKPEFPIVKILLLAVPAIAIPLAVVLNEADRRSKTLLMFLVLGFTWNVALAPLANSGSSTIGKGDFQEKYGHKSQILEYLDQQQAKREEVLWMVRAEHGGFLPYFWSQGFLWEYQWYVRPELLSVHQAVNQKDVALALADRGIRYIVAMNAEELDRFVLKGFRKGLGLPELLVDMLLQENQYVSRVFQEPESKGLELSVYRVELVSSNSDFRRR